MKVTPELQEFIRNWRKSKGNENGPASYSSLAKATKNQIRLHTFSRIEQGAVSFLLPHTITFLAKMFGFTESEFIRHFTPKENKVRESKAEYSTATEDAQNLWIWLNSQKTAVNVLRSLGYTGKLPGD